MTVGEHIKLGEDIEVLTRLAIKYNSKNVDDIISKIKTYIEDDKSAIFREVRE